MSMTARTFILSTETDLPYIHSLMCSFVSHETYMNRKRYLAVARRKAPVVLAIVFLTVVLYWNEL